MRSRLLLAAAIVLSGRLVWMYIIPAWNQIATDFPNYYTAARLVTETRPLVDLYDLASFQHAAERAGIENPPALFNYFTPFSAMIMTPVASFDPLTAKRIWVVVNIVALAASVLIVARVLGASPVLVLVVALLGGDGLGNNFTFGQFYIVLTLLLVIVVACLDRWPAIAGWCVALGAVVKLFPGIFVAYFGYLRKWRAVTWSLVAVVALTAIGIGVMGWPPHRTYIEEVLTRSLRGEIQDPYNVRWNTLQALLRRMFVAEPGLNPAPIVDAPVLYFFLRPFVVVSVLLATFIGLRGRKFTFLEFGVLIAAVSLTTPSQASYHQFLFFPAIAAAIHAGNDVRRQMLWALAFALICSNYMGAMTRWDSGPAMLLAFPRVYLVAALWFAFLKNGDVALCPRGLLAAARNPRGQRATSPFFIAAIVALISCLLEYRRWTADSRDGAVMVRPDATSLAETYPTFGPRGLMYTSLRPEGYTTLHPSGFNGGLVYETKGGVFGRLPDGREIRGSDLVEPALGPNSAVAIRGSAILEWVDGEWLELFRRETIVRDPAISPDGQSVAFAEWVNGRYRISEWNRGSSAIRTLLEGPADYRYPAYHPDGQVIAFATNESGNWDVGQYEFAGGTHNILTTSSANDYMPCFPPDGKQVYFASDRRRGYRFTAIYSIALSR